MKSTTAWTCVGVLVALGGASAAIGAKRAGYFGSEPVGSTVLNWFALWGAASLTLLILVMGERQPLSAIGFRVFTWRANIVAHWAVDSVPLLILPMTGVPQA